MSMEEWPVTFQYTEKDLDSTFIGQWDIHHVDDYGTVKAGTNSRTAVVRSKVDFDVGTVTLISYIPDRYGVTDVILDGSTGFYGKISERASHYKEHELVRADFLYIKLLSAEQVLEDSRTTTDGYKVWRAAAEPDDLIYNQDHSYSYPVYYFGKGKVSPRLVGMQVTLPIKHFNHYIHMRDLWYRDYKGSKEIHRRDE